MKLRSAAKYFDRDSVYDAYTGDYLFRAQFSSFDGSQPDGQFQKRRTMSMAPDIVLPSRRVITVQGQKWVVGEPVVEAFNNRAIRKSTSAKLVSDEFVLLTKGQAAGKSVNGLTKLYAHTKYLKDTVNVTTDGDYDPYYNVFMSQTEKPIDGWFLRSSEKLFFIRSIYKDIEGFFVAGCDEIATLNYERTGWDRDAEVDAIFDGAYDPVTDSTSGSAGTANGIILDFYKVYQYATAADPKGVSGDRVLIIDKLVVTPKAGQGFTINSIKWRVFDVQSTGDAWTLHVRRA